MAKTKENAKTAHTAPSILHFEMDAVVHLLQAPAKIALCQIVEVTANDPNFFISILYI